MKGRGELHRDGLPLVFQPRAQPSLPPPPRGGLRAIELHDSTASATVTPGSPHCSGRLSNKMATGGGGGGGFYVRLTDMRVMIQASCNYAPNSGRVPVDTARGPAPMCRALKRSAISSSTR